MEACAVAVLDAVQRPGPTALVEAHVSLRVVVTGGVDGGVALLRDGDPVVEDGHHLVASFDGQRATWTKIALDIDDDERVAGLEFAGTGSHGIPLRLSLLFYRIGLRFEGSFGGLDGRPHHGKR